MLYIMRHGKTEWNSLHKLQGRTDIPLNDEGRLMALNACTALWLNRVAHFFFMSIISYKYIFLSNESLSKRFISTHNIFPNLQYNPHHVPLHFKNPSKSSIYTTKMTML